MLGASRAAAAELCRETQRQEADYSAGSPARESLLWDLIIQTSFLSLPFLKRFSKSVLFYALIYYYYYYYFCFVLPLLNLANGLERLRLHSLKSLRILEISKGKR